MRKNTNKKLQNSYLALCVLLGRQLVDTYYNEQVACQTSNIQDAKDKASELIIYNPSPKKLYLAYGLGMIELSGQKAESNQEVQG